MSVKEPKIAFLGWNHAAERSFEALANKGWISVLIVPEKNDWRANSILQIAQCFDVPVEENVSNLTNHSYNILISSNFPKMVPKRYFEHVLALNCHWSLLPKYRGMHPTAWAILNDDDEIGQTIHVMADEFDTGDIVFQGRFKNTDDLSLQDIFKNKAKLEAQGLVEVLGRYISGGTLQKEKQNHNLATYVPQRTPEMGQIDWKKSSRHIWNLTRILPPDFYPPAYSFLNGKKVEILHTALIDSPAYFVPEGTIVCINKDKSVRIKTGDSVIHVLDVRVDENYYLAADFLKLGNVFETGQDLMIRQLFDKISNLEQQLDRQ